MIDIANNWSRAVQVELIQRKKSLPVLTEETKTSPSGRRAKSSEPFAKKQRSNHDSTQIRNTNNLHSAGPANNAVDPKVRK